MDDTAKQFMIMQPLSIYEKFKLIMGDVSWAINHRGLIADDDIFTHLKDMHDVCSKTDLKKDPWFISVDDHLPGEDIETKFLLLEIFTDKIKRPNGNIDTFEGDGFRFNKYKIGSFENGKFYAQEGLNGAIVKSWMLIDNQ